MKRVRTLVVDDEPLARSNLLVPLRRDPGIELLRECGSGAEALTAIHTEKPDLVFLDVEMPECDGFDVLEMLGADAPPAIVFVTAYDGYALRAFAAGALDYLLKPFDDARFDRALERAKERIALAGHARRADRTLVVKSSGRATFVSMSDIDWIEAADYNVRLHVGGATHVLRRSMSDLEGELDRSGFLRIHRTVIVNLERVRTLELGAGGEYDVRLVDGTCLPVSRRYRRTVRARLSS